jgi:hypothetical protein
MADGQGVGHGWAGYNWNDGILESNQNHLFPHLKSMAPLFHRSKDVAQTKIYLILKNLVLWTRSEFSRSAWRNAARV